MRLALRKAQNCQPVDCERICRCYLGGTLGERWRKPIDRHPRATRKPSTSQERARPGGLDTGSRDWEAGAMKLRDGNWSSVPSAAMRGVFAAWSVSPLRPGLVARAALGKGLVPTIVLAWVALGIAVQFSASAAPAAAKVAASPASYTFDLAYQETDEELVTRSVDIKLQSNPFQKEPTLPGQKVFRGSLVWGSRPEQDMAFIWDKGRGRLLLDLNRNRDLTDDPKGLFASASKDDYQSFTNIHMVLPTAAGDRSVRLELDFSSYQASTVRAYAGRSEEHTSELQSRQ